MSEESNIYRHYTEQELEERFSEIGQLLVTIFPE